MTRGRILLLLLAIVAASPARPAVDPFLEEFRVGRPRLPDHLPMSDAWPAGLFTPLTPEPLYAEGIVAGLQDHDGTIRSRNVLEAVFGGREAADAWLADRIGLARARDAQEIRAVAVRSAAACDSVLARADLEPDARFIWSLRRRAATDDRIGDGLWPELLDLGSYDLQGGWDLWTAHRRSRGLPLLPDGLTEEQARWVMRLRNSRLSSRDIDRAGLDPAHRSALGAASLPRASLKRHYGLYPDPPGDARLAEAWARGRWRSLGHTTAAAEALGDLAALPVRVRADYWRRAADKHVSAGRWAEGRRALEQAVELARRTGVSWVMRRVGEEASRIAAAARHGGRAEDARRAEQHAVALLPGTGEASAHGRLVRAGDAPVIKAAGADDFPDALQRIDAATWDAWYALGRRLAARTDAGLAEAFARREPAAAIVCRILRHHALRDDALWWLVVLDLERLSGDGAPAHASPVPAWLRTLGSGDDDHVVRVGLLGLCHLAGDTRGRLACAVSMPRPGLGSADRLLTHPLPSRADIVAAVAASPDPALVLGVARNESLFDPAVRSRAGALGWMQVMPFHFKGRGVEGGEAVWRRPAVSVRLGLGLLEENRRRYDGDPYRTAAAYNAGPGAVKRWDRQLGGTPSRADFLGWIGYPETRRYVEKVLIDRQIYAEVLREFGGEDPASP